MFTDLSVRYKLKEDPKLLLSISLTAGSLSSSLVALSPDALVVALSLNRTILIYSCVSGDLLEQLEGVHTGMLIIGHTACVHAVNMHLQTSG